MLLNKFINKKIVSYVVYGNIILYKKDVTLIETECPCCKTKRKLKNLHSYNFKKPALCNFCKSIGEKNPFYGKTHKDLSKRKISQKNKGKLVGENNPMFNKTIFQRWEELYGLQESNRLKEKFIEKVKLNSLRGEENPFYGKSHSDEIKKIIAHKSKLWRDGLTEIDKQNISKKLSDAQKKLQIKNPELYKKQKSDAGKLSGKTAKYKINKIEKIILSILENKNLSFKYSVILDRYQFDFGNKEYKILLEVQGDYWHGNPLVYTNLNHIQIKNKEKDYLKLEFAKKHGFKLYYIWEKDIKEGNFSVINDIENEIRTNRN